MDDFFLNIMDWSVHSVIAVALGNSVYLRDSSNGNVSKLVTFEEEYGPVTSVRWAAIGERVAVGLDSSSLQIWDTESGRKLRTLQLEGDEKRVVSLDWNDHILTSGRDDGTIVNSDSRIRSHIVGRYRGHDDMVCGVKWSDSGNYLASGGRDDLVHIWSLSKASSNQWVHRFQDHTASVKSLAWCPFQSNRLASGGGTGDHSIKFWNITSGACLNSVNAGSQITSLLWNRHEREILTSHGWHDNKLKLWKYSSMANIQVLQGHTSRVLSMAQSPDRCSVASVSADETLRIWNVFGDPKAANKLSRKREPFADFARIR